MSSGASPKRTYALGYSQQEMERLVLQAQLFDPFTRQLFEQAGISSSMRVLDVGCGAGDVSFLTAGLVGPNGAVIGVDISAAAIEYAIRRARRQSIANVQFVEGDPAQMIFDQKFDAVVGRLVLMYYPDPADALRKVVGHVRLDGIVAFQELDMTNFRSFPAAPTFQTAAKWMKKAFIASGARVNMGLELFAAFLSAGLPEPSLRADTLIGGGTQFPCQLLAITVQSLLPAMKKIGLADASHFDLPFLAERMRSEMIVRKAVAISPGLIGAWSHKST